MDEFNFDAWHAEMMQPKEEDAERSAKALYGLYKAFMGEGFTPHQALELLKAMLIGTMQNGKR